MGCDIHTYSEKMINGKWVNIDISPFSHRTYGVFGFLADIRNYSMVPPISLPRGLPNDISESVKREYGGGINWHSSSWLTVKELSEFNYDAPMEDRRVTRRSPEGWLDGGCTCEPGEGKQMTYKEFLGEEFFKDLEILKVNGVDRIVFWFDN